MESMRMVTKKSSKKAPANRRHPLNSYNFFLILASLLGIMAGILMVRQFYHESIFSIPRPVVSLGPIEYTVKDGKATKNTNSTLTSLRSFLEKNAKTDCKNMGKPARYFVRASTDDVSQVLLGYGCGDSSASMYAVRTGDTWKFISPTNHFDTFGIPECDYVSNYVINKQIAPVCYVANNHQYQVC